MNERINWKNNFQQWGFICFPGKKGGINHAKSKQTTAKHQRHPRISQLYMYFHAEDVILCSSALLRIGSTTSKNRMLLVLTNKMG